MSDVTSSRPVGGQFAARGLPLAQAVLLVAAIILGSLAFWNSASQSPSWIYPFFSGAANLGLDFKWRIDAAGYPAFEAMSYAQQMALRLQPGDAANLVPYEILDKGYVFVVWIAQTLFFWMPQIKGVIWLQIAVHTLTSLFVLSRLEGWPKRLAFVLAFAVNPLILHFVTFAFYYYWQVLPPLAWFAFETRRSRAGFAALIALFAVLVAAFFIRQSTLILSFAILVYAAWQMRKRLAWLAPLAFVVLVILAKNPSQPWHTAYVGIGAYPNAANIALDDEAGYKLFNETTGIKIDTTPVVGNYYDRALRDQYYAVVKQAFFDHAKAYPVEMIRNAALSMAESFSGGYVVGSLKLTLVSAAVGLLMFGLMIYRRLYILAGLLIAGSAGYVEYFPPIPAYMFGNFVLIALAGGHILEWLAAAIGLPGAGPATSEGKA